MNELLVQRGVLFGEKLKVVRECGHKNAPRCGQRYGVEGHLR